MPRFSSAKNQFIESSDAATLKASAAQTSSTTGTVVDAGSSGAREVLVDVTAASGTTPTMTVVIECQSDGTNWVEAGTVGSNGARVGAVGTAPANFTAVSSARAVLPLTGLTRYRSVIGGTTPSFTYSVSVI